MSEYWKSTPKYWCKHCSAYVRDTKFERAQHEATGKHQGSLKRFLRGIQIGHEKDDREKQRVKVEIDRLNRTVGGPSAILGQSGVSTTRGSVVAASATQVSAAERKQQLARLAEMGIAIPDEFRADMALAGDWKIVAQRPIDEASSNAPLCIGVRKRKHEDEEEDDKEEVGGTVAKGGWGSTFKKYPGDGVVEKEDLDDLLSGKTPAKKEVAEPCLEEEIDDALRPNEGALPPDIPADDGVLPDGHSTIKLEQADDEDLRSKHLPSTIGQSQSLEVVFKKRKPKATRTK